MTENDVARKVVDAAFKVHKKQLLTYLRLSRKRLGLLINFGEALIRDGITRVVNGLPDDAENEEKRRKQSVPH
jgi:hypothetical protein